MKLAVKKKTRSKRKYLRSSRPKKKSPRMRRQSVLKAYREGYKLGYANGFEAGHEKTYIEN